MHFTRTSIPQNHPAMGIAHWIRPRNAASQALLLARACWWHLGFGSLAIEVLDQLHILTESFTISHHLAWSYVYIYIYTLLIISILYSNFLLCIYIYIIHIYIYYIYILHIVFPSASQPRPAWLYCRRAPTVDPPGASSWAARASAVHAWWCYDLDIR